METAWPTDLPVIENSGPLPEHVVHHYARCLGGEVREAAFLPASAPVQGVRIGSGTAGGQRANVTAWGSAQVVSDATDAKGVRAVALSVIVSAKQADYTTAMPLADLVAKVRQVIEAQPGSCFSGLGRVESVDIRHAGPGGPGLAQVSAEATVTFLSRVPNVATAA